MDNRYVLVHIIGSGVDKLLILAKKGYDNREHDELLSIAMQNGVSRPEIVGHIDVPDELADEICEGRVYLG